MFWIKMVKTILTLISLWTLQCSATPYHYDEHNSYYSYEDVSIRTTCIVKGNEWKICKECDPSYGGSNMCYFNPTNECKCMNIIVKGQGGSDCQSRDRDGKWCYVDSSSECSDKRKSQLEKPTSWVDNDLHYSYQACQNFNEYEFEAKEAAFGNEAFIPDHVLKGEDLTQSLGGGGFPRDTPEQCQAECLARAKICFGWTFDDHDGRKGICTLKGAGICCNQNSKKVKKEGAISGFVCDNCNKTCTSCWSTSGACPCNQEVERFDPNFGAGGTNLTAFSASAGIGSTKRNCEYARILYRFIRGRWRPVERIGTDKATC